MPAANRIASPVPSPCVNICAVDERGSYCKGCFRTLAEVAAWPRMSEEEKRAVWARLDARRKASVPGSD